MSHTYPFWAVPPPPPRILQKTQRTPEGWISSRVMPNQNWDGNWSGGLAFRRGREVKDLGQLLAGEAALLAGNVSPILLGDVGV